jgi:hypothetical protein
MKKTLYSIGVLLIAGVAVYSIYSYVNAKDSSSNEKDYIIQQSEAGFDYTNNLYDYRISFSNDWKMDENSNVDNAVFYDSVAQQQEMESELIQGMKIEILTSEVDREKSLEQIVEEKIIGLSEESLISNIQISVNNLSAREVQIDALGFSITTFIKEDSHLFSIVGYIGDVNEKEEYVGMYREILKTFELVSQN